MPGLTWKKKIKFPDPFGPKVFVHYGGGQCVTIQQDGCPATISMGRERAILMARSILKRLNEPVEEPDSVKQGELPF